MAGLTEHQLLLGLIALAVILAAGRTGGEVAKRLGQAEVLGELMAGVLLGPSLLGVLAPHLYQTLFQGYEEGIVLSGLSWIGAILLLLIAGIEVDLRILRQVTRPGALAAVGAIGCSLIGGVLFAQVALGRSLATGFLLGIVLSTTAVSVAAKVLIEREVMRRSYAQVIVAAGVASEIVAWVLVSTVSGAGEHSPLAAGLRGALFALLFLGVMFTLGRRTLFWALRRMADTTQIARGQLSMVLVLGFLAAAVTQALGLHALLGPFVVGVLLNRAPRSDFSLLEGIQALTSSLFGPIFFVLAGMRVNVLLLNSPSALALVAALFILATLVKVGAGGLGARLGGVPWWEAAMVGVGLNVKSGTDVVVAIVGVELGLLPQRAYSMYAVVAILTVVISPPVMNWLAKRTPPSEAEQARLTREEAERRAYAPGIERVLLPVLPELLPSLPSRIVGQIALAKQGQGQFFDITEFVASDGALSIQNGAPADQEASEAMEVLNATTGAEVEVVQRVVAAPDPQATALQILAATKDHNLLALGMRPPQASRRTGSLTLNGLHRQLIAKSQADVLVVSSQEDELATAEIRRVLVPLNGHQYSLAAGDLAAYLARSYDAELVAFVVASPRMDSLFWRENLHARLRAQAHALVKELIFRVSRLDVPVTERIVVADDPAQALLRELKRESYDLVVMGGIDRGSGGRPYLGRTTESVLLQTDTPVVLLISKPVAA